MIISTRILGIFKVLSDCPTGMNEEEHGSLQSGNLVPVGFEVIASEMGVT
jgi:hypothetical protein